MIFDYLPHAAAMGTILFFFFLLHYIIVLNRNGEKL